MDRYLEAFERENKIVWERVDELEKELHSCFHRIEKLQTALREIAYTEPEDKYWPGRIARKALEGKDDT